MVFVSSLYSVPLWIRSSDSVLGDAKLKFELMLSSFSSIYLFSLWILSSEYRMLGGDKLIFFNLCSLICHRDKYHVHLFIQSNVIN